MGPGALLVADDARSPRVSRTATLALADDGLRLAGFAIAKADGFDEERIAALLAAAYGSSLVFDYQREGNLITGFTQLPQFRPVSNFSWTVLPTSEDVPR
jgi:hypothetical protein